MKKTTLLLFLLLSTFYWSQIEKKNMKTGIITIITNEKIAFRDLLWNKDKAKFIDAKTNEIIELYDASIKSIEELQSDDSKFTNLAMPSQPELPKHEINNNFYKPDYPEGVYYTKEDFINKKVTNINLTKRSLIGFEKKVVDDNEQNCFFYDSSNIKLKNVFAVVYHGLLYFSIKNILQNRNKTDRAQESDFPNSFTQVLMGGNNYLYVETELANAWAKGLAYGLAGQGGAIGGAGIAMSSSTFLNNGKGIVWDFKNLEFNIFKNCEDYNDFIKDKSPSDVQKCENNQPDNFKVRAAISKIK